MDQITLKYAVATIVVIGCLILLLKGIDGEVKALLGVIVGYLFGENKGTIIKGKTNAGY